MKTRKNTRLTTPTKSQLIWSCIAIAIIITTIWIYANPLRRSEKWIHDRALKEVPLGSTQAQLAIFAKAKGWEIELELHTGNNPEIMPKPDGTLRKSPLNGEYLTRIDMGHFVWFPVPIRVDVESYWIFDPNGKLVELYIWKVADLP